MAKISAMLLLGTGTGSERNVYDKLSKHEEIEFVHELFGSWDIIAKIQTEDFQNIDVLDFWGLLHTILHRIQ